MKKEKLAPAPAPAKWTRIEDYLAGQRLRSAERRRRSARPAAEPERARPIWTLAPFVALFAALAVIAASIMILAYPGARSASATRQPAPTKTERGTAPPGWFEAARREMR